MPIALLFAAALSAAVPFLTVAKGDTSGQEIMRRVTVRTHAEWQSIWKVHHPDGKPPDVDFGSRMVVGLFLGSKPSAGWDVEIVGARIEQKDLVVEYVQRQPGRGTMSAQMVIEPYHLVAVAKHAGPVRFVQVADIRR